MRSFNYLFFLMAPNFWALATTLGNLGARWLLAKKVNFVPWSMLVSMSYYCRAVMPAKDLFQYEKYKVKFGMPSKRLFKGGLERDYWKPESEIWPKLKGVWSKHDRARNLGWYFFCGSANWKCTAKIKKRNKFPLFWYVNCRTKSRFELVKWLFNTATSSSLCFFPVF